jgi:prepilin-type N-terminal cleavage/methylation domain-containing protein
MRRHERGFTFAELSLVIAVVGTLTVIGVSTYSKMVTRAKEGTVCTNAHALQMKVESFTIVNGYPPWSHTAFNDPMMPELGLQPNPFTGQETQIQTPNDFSKGDLGYSVNSSTQVYRIVAFGRYSSGGPNGDGIVLEIESF